MENGLIDWSVPNKKTSTSTQGGGLIDWSVSVPKVSIQQQVSAPPVAREPFINFPQIKENLKSTWPETKEQFVTPLSEPLKKIGRFIKRSLGKEGWKAAGNITGILPAADYLELATRYIAGGKKKVLDPEEQTRLDKYAAQTELVGQIAIIALAGAEAIPAIKNNVGLIANRIAYKGEKINPKAIFNIARKVDRGEKISAWEQSVFDRIKALEPSTSRAEYIGGKKPLYDFVPRKAVSGVPAVVPQVKPEIPISQRMAQAVTKAPAGFPKSTITAMKASADKLGISFNGIQDMSVVGLPSQALFTDSAKGGTGSTYHLPKGMTVEEGLKNHRAEWVRKGGKLGLPETAQKKAEVAPETIKTKPVVSTPQSANLETLNKEIAKSSQAEVSAGETFGKGLNETIAKNQEWITYVLRENKHSTDAELSKYFQEQGGFSKEVSEYIVAHRKIAQTPTKSTPKPAEIKPETVTVYHAGELGGNIIDRPTHFGTLEQAKERLANVKEFGQATQKETIKPYAISGKFMRVDDLGGNPSSWETAAKEAKQKGYTGLVYKNDFESAGNVDSYVVFSKEQINPLPNEPLGVEGYTEKILPINKIKAVGTKDSFDPFSLEYSKNQIKSGKPIEPIEVRLEKGKYVIEDGEHRFQAYKELGIKEIPVKIQNEPTQPSSVKQPELSPETKALAEKWKREDTIPEGLEKPSDRMVMAIKGKGGIVDKYAEANKLLVDTGVPNPQKSVDWIKSIVEKNPDEIVTRKAINVLSDGKMNPRTRQAFELVTGIKLPATQKESKVVLERIAGLESKKQWLTAGEVKKAVGELEGKMAFLDRTGRNWKAGRQSYLSDKTPVKIIGIEGNRVVYSRGKGNEYSAHIDDVRDIVVDGKSYLEGIKQSQIDSAISAKPSQKISSAIKSYSAGYGGAGKIVSGEPSGKPSISKVNERIKFALSGGRKLGQVYKEQLGPELITKHLRKWEGLFKYPPSPNGKVAVRTMENLGVLAHETGHFLDLLLGKYPIAKGGSIRKELIALTKQLRPFEENYSYGISEKTGKPTKRQDAYSSYRRSRQELFADYISAYATQPELAKKIAPQFTAIIEENIASGSETGKAIDYIVNKLKQFNEEFNPLIDYVDSLRKIPEFRTQVEASFEKGNPLQMWYRKSVGDKLWNLLSGKLDKMGQAKFVKAFFEKGGVPDPVFFAAKERLRLMHGQVAKLQEELIEPMKALTPEDKYFISQALQNFTILKGNTPAEELTEMARGELALWGNEARKLGLLNDQVFWNNVGQYYPYFYSTKEFTDNKVKFGIATKAIRTNLKSFKHRLSDSELIRKGLEAKYGTWPNQLLKVENEMAGMSAEDIKVEARKIREEMGLIEKNPEYSLYKRMASLIQSVYTAKTLNQMATIPGVIGRKNQDGYLLMPESASLGAMSGQWVERNTAEAINEWNPLPDDLMKVFEVVTQVWKTVRVPYNPAAVSRNIVSNFMLQWMVGDVPVWNPTYAGRGIKSFLKKDDAYTLLRDNGLYKRTYAQQEMHLLAGKEQSLPGIVEWAVKAFNKPGDVYGAVEDIGKTIIARYVLDHGGSVGQALDLAQKVLFDYSNVSVVTNKLRKFPIPFITFSAKVLPRMVEVAVRKPEKFLLFLLMLVTAEEYARNRLKMSKEQIEAVKPEYLKGNKLAQPYILLPNRYNGQLQFIDLSYFAPWGGWTQPTKTAKFIPQPLQLGNPFIIAYNAYVLGFDPFAGREISPQYLTISEQRQARNKYFSRGILPDLLGGRATERMVKVIKSEPDYYGNKPNWKREVLRDLSGVNIILGGELTTGISVWKKEQDRKTIERRRPAKLAVIEWLEHDTPKTTKRAGDLLKKLSKEEMETVIKSAVTEYKARKSGARLFMNLPKKQKLQYLGGMP